MVARRFSLNSLFIFTAFVAIALACVTGGSKGYDSIHVLISAFGWLGLFGLSIYVVSFLLGAKEVVVFWLVFFEFCVLVLWIFTRV